MHQLVAVAVISSRDDSFFIGLVFSIVTAPVHKTHLDQKEWKREPHCCAIINETQDILELIRIFWDVKYCSNLF
ncbi:MAG: hypothetical protein WCI87_02420 [Euryarchaeota archaeon]